MSLWQQRVDREHHQRWHFFALTADFTGIATLIVVKLDLISPRFLPRLPQLVHIFSANLFQCHIGRPRTNFVILHKRWFLLHILAASWPWRVVLIATYCNPSMTKFVSSYWTNSFSKSPSFALNIPLPSTTSVEVESETRKCKNYNEINAVHWSSNYLRWNDTSEKNSE